MMFKIGDSLLAVKVAHSNHEANPYIVEHEPLGGNGFREGRVGTVKNVTKSNDNIPPIYWFNEFENGVHEPFLQLANEENSFSYQLSLIAKEYKNA